MTGLRIVNISGEMVAAAKADDTKWRPKRRGWSTVPDYQVARLLTGAYELIAAAERERIRQLAIQHSAEYNAGDDDEVCCDDECHGIWLPFASLLAGDAPEGDSDG